MAIKAVMTMAFYKEMALRLSSNFTLVFHVKQIVGITLSLV